MDDDEPSRRRSPFVPLVLLTLAFLTWASFQTTQLVRERRGLQAAKANQEATIQQAEKLRAQLDALARATADLASNGNANAGTIVQELAKRGITINPNAPPVAPALR